MSDKSGRFRNKKINFSMVSNSIIRDSAISLKAKGLYALIQSYITLENFTLYKSFLMKQCCEGERAFDSAWKELKKTGYLKMHKLREGAKTFAYEYELLDEPEKHEQRHSVDLQNVGVENEGLKEVQIQNVCGTECGHINNTVSSNTVSSNTVSNNINQIISVDDVMEQIDYKYLYPDQKEKAYEIALLIAEVLNMPDDTTIRIARTKKPIAEVKERFRSLKQFHIQYVIGCIQANTTKVSNIKSYLLTALYNSLATMETYYQSEVNHDLYSKQ